MKKRLLALAALSMTVLPLSLPAAGLWSGMPFMGASPYQNPLLWGGGSPFAAQPFGSPFSMMSPWGMGSGLPMLGSGMSPFGSGLPMLGSGMSPFGGGMPMLGSGMSPWSGLGGMPFAANPYTSLYSNPYAAYGYGMSPYLMPGAGSMMPMSPMGGVNPMFYPRLY